MFVRESIVILGETNGVQNLLLLYIGWIDFCHDQISNLRLVDGIRLVS